MIQKRTVRQTQIILLAILLLVSNAGITFAYWASGIATDNVISDSDATTGVGDWVFCNPIFTAQDFYDFATSSTSLSTDNYCLRNDIDFSSFTWEYLAAHTTNQFRGTFNGNNYALRNITIETTASGTAYLSLFARMDGGTIKNVTIENYKMGFTVAYFNSSTIQAGIFAGEVTGTNNLIENITILNADVIANTLNGGGGLVGQVEANADLTIRNIKATDLTVLNSSKRAGGLISRAQSGTGVITIEDIDLQGNIASGNSTSNNGGIFGTFRRLSGTIDRVIVEYIAEGSIDLADGTITYKADRYVGGFVGNNNNASAMTISDAFYTGELYNNIANVGTVLGRKSEDIVLNNVFYSNVFFVNGYTPSTSTSVINSTVVNASSMPNITWWNGFYVSFDAANDLWTQDGTGRPVLIRP